MALAGRTVSRFRTDSEGNQAGHHNDRIEAEEPWWLLSLDPELQADDGGSKL